MEDIRKWLCEAEVRYLHADPTSERRLDADSFVVFYHCEYNLGEKSQASALVIFADNQKQAKIKAMILCNHWNSQKSLFKYWV
jgi:hypothetical protein